MVSSWDYTTNGGAFNYNLIIPNVSIPLEGIICIESPHTLGQWYLNYPQFQVGQQDTMNSPKADGKALVFAKGIECAGIPLDCPEYINHNALETVSGIYQAEQQIVSISTITPANNVVLNAGQSTKLGLHFEMQLGAVFEVLTGGCIP